MDVKAGWRTSEFWLRLLGKALGGGIAVTGLMQQNQTAQIAGVIMGGLLALLSLHGYGEQRTQLKLAALRADIASTTQPSP